MSTKSIRSSGTQLNQRGVTQGNTLVDPVSGLPINVILDNSGIRRLAVDAALTVDNIVVDTRDLTPQTDGVRIQDPSNSNILHINSDGSIDTNVQLNAASDNVAIADATSGFKLKVNADGSINTVTASSTAGTPTIFNVTVPNANTEVSQLLPAATKQFMFSVRDSAAKAKLAYVSGQSGLNYISIGRGEVYSQDNILLTSTTLYFQLDKAGQIVEILTWN